jgi:hypothetical protein
MISDARNGHVSPGIYTNERDVTYSVKSLGVTSLGLVGETLYGPAFQNVEITNWAEFVDYFGGTSPIKFKDGTPKYELPYIAKSYLEESKRLNVVRVLGLSGYDAGKAWVIYSDSANTPAIVLRSKMVYGKTTDACATDGETAKEIVSNIAICGYTDTLYTQACKNETAATGSTTGKFQIVVTCNGGYDYNTTLKYNVSLNPSDSDYIYNVISKRPDTGTTPIYIDAIYESNIDSSFTPSAITSIESASTVLNRYYKITDVLSANSDASAYTYEIEEINEVEGAINVVGSNVSGNIYTSTTEYSIGQSIYTSAQTGGVISYRNYKENYRAAQTPWIVSDALIDSGTSKINTYVRKLFRFITISDGDAANFQVKVSIQNINVEDGSFDVVVRDYYDTDANPLILETFRKCNLVDGDANYLAYRIGSADGGYVSKSKYILVQMADGEDFGKSIPAGFMGYPMPSYNSSDTKPSFKMKYNVVFEPGRKAKKQYFGCSDIVGIDSDVFTYKGQDFYSEKPGTLTSGFHMDSVLGGTIWVDGVSGYNFTTVSKTKVTSTGYAPRLSKVSYIDSTIYRDIKTRKFTVCFFGGFDGWDVNRTSRTNTDKYKSTKYSVIENNDVFSNVINKNDLNLPLNLSSTAITSDYYAYLAGVRVFANPQDVDINILATPGINWLDNALLTQEIIEVVEDSEDGRGGDALYVMASPNLADADEARDVFESVDINSSYACTYFPWVMYYDDTNRRYLDLPVTKDIVRNMAATDNKSYPWFAPAGTERGNVNCVKAAFKTTLADEDALYEVGINPVKSFAQDGVKIWGNKTTYSVESPLNRINVRRLMIRVKKLISDAAKHLIFEQYDETLEKQFRGIVEPILADVKANRGIIDYRVITECTPETRDQHILPAKILIKPTQSLEYISISFTVYPESVSFED